MKREEVILRAYAKKISWIEAAGILGMSCRHLLRVREKYQEWGFDGLQHAPVGRESPRRIPIAVIEEVLRLYWDEYVNKGVFCALYSDRASHFFRTPKAGEPVDRQALTHVGRALRELGIQLIPAYSPQARTK